MKTVFIYKRLTILSIAFMVLLFYSCNTIIKIYYGLKKPKIENYSSIVKYLDKIKLEKEGTYSFEKKDVVNTLKLIKGVPEVMIFHSNGKLITYRQDSACNAGAFSFIENLSKEIDFQFNDSIQLDDYLSKLRDFQGNAINFNLIKNDSTDFYLFIYWTKYSGRLNKNHVRVWETQAKNNSKSRIKIIKVNLDMQEWWDKKKSNEKMPSG